MSDKNKVHPMFAGAAQKFNWACYKLNGFENIVSVYGMRLLKVEALEEADGSKKIRVEAMDMPFPRPPYIGDILRNLRGSLDHATSAMLRAVDKRDDKDYFPIGDDAASFSNFVKIFLERSNAEKITDFFIERVDARKEGKSRDIWYLNQMDRANKHRQLVVIEEAVVAPVPDMEGGSTLISECYFQLAPGQVMEQKFPAWMNVTGFSHSMPPCLTVKFGDNEALPSENVINVLNRFREKVQSILVDLQNEYISKYPERAEKFIQ